MGNKSQWMNTKKKNGKIKICDGSFTLFPILTSELAAANCLKAGIGFDEWEKT